MPQIKVSDLIERFATRLNTIVDPQAYLRNNFPPSYYYYPLKKDSQGEQLATKALEEMIHSRHGGTVFTNPEGDTIIGINLCQQEVGEDFFEACKVLEGRRRLEALNLAETQLRSLSIGRELKDLVHLDVSRNGQLKHLSFELATPRLKTLDAYECSIEEVIFPDGMRALYRLDFSRNKKLNKCVFQGGCPSLVSLHLSDNILSELYLPKGFDSLAYAYLDGNQLASLDYSLAEDLPALSILDVKDNQLTRLPQDFLNLASLENFFAYGNAFRDVTEEIILSDERGDSFESVRNYLISLKGKTENLLEAKMILIGNGFAGKTSLLRKLLDREAPLPEDKERTPGLALATYPVSLVHKVGGKELPVDFKLNAWDFGGQAKYREVQQLFCSRKSLYIFVEAVNNRQEEEDYIGDTYWLNMARAYGYDDQKKESSPVLHVKNKIDLTAGRSDTNAADLQKEYPEIQRFLDISCLEIKKYKIEFDLLEKAIKDSIPKISKGIFEETYASDWMDIKSVLESRREEHHMPYHTYEQLCKERDIDPSAARTWIRVLDNIGTVIYFEDHPKLKDWVILNPLWVRDAIYKVIDSEFVEDGILKPKFFPIIWDKDEFGHTHEEEEYSKFIALMEAYNLCYKQEDDRGREEYIMPSCFPEEPSVRLPGRVERREVDFRLKIEFDPFIPAGMVNKLIVKVKRHDSKDFASVGQGKIKARKEEFGDMGGVFHHDIRVYKNCMWKNHVLLHDAEPRVNVFALVREVWKEKAIYVDLFGPAQEAKLLFARVEAMLKAIMKDLKDARRLKRLEMEALALSPETKSFLSLEALDQLGKPFFVEDGAKTKKDRKQELKSLAADGEFEKVLDVLEEELSEEEFGDEIVALRHRIKTARKNKTKNNWTVEYYQQEMANILDAIQELIKELK